MYTHIKPPSSDEQRTLMLKAVVVQNTAVFIQANAVVITCINKWQKSKNGGVNQ